MSDCESLKALSLERRAPRSQVHQNEVGRGAAGGRKLVESSDGVFPTVRSLSQPAVDALELTGSRGWHEEARKIKEPTGWRSHIQSSVITVKPSGGLKLGTLSLRLKSSSACEDCGLSNSAADSRM